MNFAASPKYGRIAFAAGQGRKPALMNPQFWASEQDVSFISENMPRGTVQIVRNFYTTEAEGVYDMVFTPDGQEQIEGEQVVRRFYGEQELSDFLKHHLRVPQRTADEAICKVMNGERASIPNLEFRIEELRRLKLAA
jgi:hypothetical protein